MSEKKQSETFISSDRFLDFFFLAEPLVLRAGASIVRAVGDAGPAPAPELLLQAESPVDGARPGPASAKRFRRTRR